MRTPTVSPMPPVATAVGLPWDVPIEDPVGALADARRALGDTFVVDSGEDRYLFTFSPVGVQSFYALPEERASKGVADWRMLRRKLPDEMFDGRRTLPHQLFGREDVAAYLANVERALDDTIVELGVAGDVEVFELTRRLGHRAGLASWGGPGSATGERFDRLARAFDALDGIQQLVVHPGSMAEVARTGKVAEYEALAVVLDELGRSLEELPGGRGRPPALRPTGLGLGRRAGRGGQGRGGAGRRPHPHRIHVQPVRRPRAGTSSTSWPIPTPPRRSGAGDAKLAETCALESIRLAQRSIMARYALEPVTLDVGATRHEVAAGVTIATLLPLTNTSAAPDLATWDPNHWNRRRLAGGVRLEAIELVTAFGHGRHTCPAQPFSLSAMTTAAGRLLAAYDLQAGWDDPPAPVRAQIGGVARSAAPCPLRYVRRNGRSLP